MRIGIDGAAAGIGHHQGIGDSVRQAVEEFALLRAAAEMDIATRHACEQEHSDEGKRRPRWPEPRMVYSV